mmetsp:Transcript_27098/g.48615  ORF Transcript_27098/g.48615 Transcript_27098/m.48615 type:complete len:128 (+) Transcript_27098:1414-1797(+)
MSTKLRPLNLELLETSQLSEKLMRYGQHSSPVSVRSSITSFRKSPRKKIKLELVSPLTLPIDTGPNYAGRAVDQMRKESLSETIRISRRINLAAMKPMTRKIYWTSSKQLKRKPHKLNGSLCYLINT